MTTTPKLDAAIAYHSHWPTQADELQAEAFREIREHLKRIPAPTKTLDLKSLNYDGTPATRYPSEAETRLIELCETAIANLQARGASNTGEMLISQLAAIKRDLGIS